MPQEKPPPQDRRKTGLPGSTRQAPLPWHRPKSERDDPEAAARVRKIVENPSYIQAVKDSEFFERDELRAARLQLEYLKPEIILSEHGINSTIVVFGGTRVLEPAAARRQVDGARAELSRSPEDPEVKRRLRVAERVLAKSHYYDVARELGRIVSGVCQLEGRCEFVIVTGGGPGIMEAGNRGAFDVGSKSIGLNITLPHEQYPNPYITPDLTFQFRYFGLRKMHFMKRAKALVAFPGGYGTFDEVFEALTLIQTRKIRPRPIILVGEEFWRQAFNADFLAAEGVIDPEDVELFSFAETAQEIWDSIVEWYHATGEEIVDARSGS
jgi:uncharacterized protein (TIGR00730 family)